MGELTHFDEQGHSRMVEVGGKQETRREAIAKGVVTMHPQTLKLVKEGQVSKGDVLGVARVAGIMAAKKTSDLIPMCHPLLLTGVDIYFNLLEEENQVEIEARVRVTGKTGVEMEALTAVSAAALTIYDMCKAVDKEMVLGEIRLMKKTGGKSGTFVRGEES